MTEIVHELIRDAVRGNNAERDLADMRERIETFTVEVPPPSALGFASPEVYAEITEREVATRLGRILMAHHHRGDAIARRDSPDGHKRFVVTVLLRK